MTTETGIKSPNEFAISKEQKEKISDILTDISKLTNLEKWYLHLKLPSCPVLEEKIKSNSPVSLSTSKRASITLNWIQSHYVEARRVCVPKQEIYNQYRLYCDSMGFNPFAMTDFGKILKTAFPNIHDRRLGQRGKSKYCYGGLRKITTAGEINDSEAAKMEEQQSTDPMEDLESLSSQLVCEWASCLLGKNFSSIKSLAQYLVSSGASCGKKAALFNMLHDDMGSSSTVPDRKNTASQLQDNQALIQRKLLQKEVLKEHRNLLKQQETTQRDLQAAQSTLTRLAVLSPNIHFTHSTDQPSTLHVLNFNTNSIPSVSNLPLGLERYAVTNVHSSVSGSCYAVNKDPNGCHSLNESTTADVKTYGSQSVKVKSKSKQSKLISSKSLEDSNQRHPKRNGDFLHNANQGKDSKRRRCITSLGMTGLQGPSPESREDDSEEHKEAVRMRPFSCPVFYDNMQTLECDMESEEIQTSENSQILQTAATPDPSLAADSNNASCTEVENVTNETITDSKIDVMSKSENASNSFHFVRKPMVISMKPPDKTDSCEPVLANTDNVCDSNSTIMSPVKKSHHILNSILSSSDSNLPQYLSSAEKRVSSFAFSDCLTKSEIRDCDKYNRKEPHTLDNAYLLPCQSSRSAFVRVMNGKGHHADDRLEITPRPRYLSFDGSTSHSHNNHNSSEADKFPEVSKSTITPKSPESCDQTNKSDAQIPNRKESTENFKPITVSVSSSGRCSSTIVDVVKLVNGSLTTKPATETIVTPSKSNFSEPLLSRLPQTTCESSPVTCQAKRLITKSPVTPPKRQSRSRFTPIRPKLGGCNVSPQKTDMRPVAAILKEQRARSAQELLVNLASSYQGGIKVQVLADLIGISSTDKSSSDVVVNIGNSNKLDQSVKAPLHHQQLSCQPNKEISVVLDSMSNPITTQSSPFLSPQKIISSSPNMAMMPSMSSTVSNILNRPAGLEANTQINASSSSVVPSSSETTSPSTILSTLSHPLQSRDSQVIVADAKGTMYSLDNEAVKPLPKVSSLQQLLQANTDSLPSGTPQTQSIINVSDIKGHVVGPDALGQTYLLVPNTEAATLPVNVAVTATSTSVISSPSKEMQSVVSRSRPRSVISSSSALLSELSHLASVSDKDKNKQPIQHDSTVSAFQKCEPNKVAMNIDQKSQSLCDVVNTHSGNFKHGIQIQMKDTSLELGGKGNLYRCQSAQNILSYEHSDGQELGEISVRKRKASNGQDEKVNEKKRQNTTHPGNVVMDTENLVLSAGSGKEEVVLGNNEPFSSTAEKRGTVNELKSENIRMNYCNQVEISDTEALLDLISDSRSMTVKETVMAMNTLQARMKKSHVPAPITKLCKDESLVRALNSDSAGLSSNKAKNTNPKAKQSDGRKSSQIQRVRRNTSLNLESLESDALLDTELLLDRHLVEEMKCYKNGRADLKTSVAVAAKTSHSLSADRKGEQSRKTTDLNYHANISPKALQSYHMILSEKSRSSKDKKSNKEVQDKNKATSVERELNLYKEKQGGKIVSENQKSHTTVRRSMSMVQDILERGRVPVVVSSNSDFKKSQLEFNSSEVDAFDALLSKMHSKPFPTLSGTRSQSALQDSEIPVDIVDFVTESMTYRKPISERTSDSQAAGAKSAYIDILSYQSSKTQLPLGPRSISVPNTKPDFFDFGPAPTIGIESLSTLRPSTGDRNVTGETDNSVNKNVFLSPVGPAKLARRPSVEKSAQSQVDRSRTPVEILTAHSGSQFTAVKEKHSTDVYGTHKAQVSERRRTKTPVDKNLQSNEKLRAKTPVMIQHSVEKGSQRPEEHVIRRSPVNRSLAKTPIEKFFIKQTSDPLPIRSELLSQQPASRREDPMSVHTPTSDSGYGGGSVSQTPISDFGYNSVSPSPVMMSSASYYGECGRNLSPATIFMPLRSDSAVSLNNNNLRSESPASITQINQMDNLPGFVSEVERDHLIKTNSLDNTLSQKDKSDGKDTLPEFTPDVPDIPSFLESLSSKALFLSDLEGKDDSEVIKSSSDTKTLMKLISSSLQSIPTPPISPTSSPTNVSSSNNIPLPFSVPVSPPLPHHDSNSSPPSALPCVLLPPFLSGSSSSSLTHASGRQLSLSPHCRSQDLPSPAMIARGYTPSPQILARPPSSPHQYSSHPSPPFTPCSLRSLPSPRCLTPSSHKSLISPRSVTPSSDPNQAPNRFMPIQSSGVLPTSQAPTYTYIQPIKPVVALASASSNSNSTNADMSRSLNSFNKGLLQSSGSPANSQGISSDFKQLQFMPSTLTNPSSQSQQGVNSFDVIRTSEHKPLEANSTLVLSLSGDIGSFSSQGVGMSWGNTDLQKDSFGHASVKGKQSDFRQLRNQGNKSSLKPSTRTSDSVFQLQRSDKSSCILTTSPHSKPYCFDANKKSQVLSNYSQDSQSASELPSQPLNIHAKQNNHSSLLKLLSGQPNSNQTDIYRFLVNPQSSTTAFKPPPSTMPLPSSSAAASIHSFKPVIKNATSCHPLMSTSFSPKIQQAKIDTNTQNIQTDVTTNSVKHDNTGILWSTNQTLQNLSRSEIGRNLCSSTQDELQVTLDVLKNMDSQYFQYDEEGSTL